MPRVGFRLRSLALLLDVVLFLFVYVAAVVILLVAAPRFATPRVFGTIGSAAWLVITLPEALIAASPGKLVLGLRIDQAQGTGADFWTLFLRWSSKQFPAICQLLFNMTGALVFYLIGGFSATVIAVGCLYASTEFKQAWHDQWAGTAVFRSRPQRVATAAARPE